MVAGVDASPHKLPEMFVVPAATPVANPVVLMVATDGVAELQLTAFVTVAEPAVAVNCAVCPIPMVVFAGGLMVTEVKAVPVTVTVALPGMLFATAVTVAVPGPSATPVLLPFMHTVLFAEELQCASAVTS
jgi:hypothetical protein